MRQEDEQQTDKLTLTFGITRSIRITMNINIIKPHVYTRVGFGGGGGDGGEGRGLGGGGGEG